MVAVKNHEADRFLARPAPHIYLYLVFGTDAGLAAERAQKIIKGAIDDPKDPFQLVRIAGDELAADPLRLADEANTIPLFGGRRAILIEAQGKAFATALEPVLRGPPPQDCTIVIEAGALKKDAPLRVLCERGKNAAAIQCYPDSAKDIAQLIEAEVAGSGLTIAPDAKAFLVSQLGQDRLSTRLELEKLMLFAHGGGEIRLDHVEAIVSNASSLMAAKAVNAAFEGDLSQPSTRVCAIWRARAIITWCSPVLCGTHWTCIALVPALLMNLRERALDKRMPSSGIRGFGRKRALSGRSASSVRRSRGRAANQNLDLPPPSGHSGQLPNPSATKPPRGDGAGGTKCAILPRKSIGFENIVCLEKSRSRHRGPPHAVMDATIHAVPGGGILCGQGCAAKISMLVHPSPLGRGGILRFSFGPSQIFASHAVKSWLHPCTAFSEMGEPGSGLVLFLGVGVGG